MRLFLLILFLWEAVSVPTFPIVINTWGGPFVVATQKAWQVINDGSSTALDAVEQGCTACEVAQCDGTVGYGGSPDEIGETTLDAMIMDGVTMAVGAVGDLRYVKNAISVARAVMDYTTHTLMAGESAMEFAVMMGFASSNLTTPASELMHQQWLAANCQPNYRVNVLPDPTTSCGPYKPNGTLPSVLLQERQEANKKKSSSIKWKPGVAPPRSTREHHESKLHRRAQQLPQQQQQQQQHIESAAANNNIQPSQSQPSQQSLYNQFNHDTIAMIVMDANSTMAAGTTTNGARFKVPGRVGDSPIMGAGAYVDNDVGGCGATGDGDTMMRFLPCFYVVELMRSGVDPTTASITALTRIASKYPTFQGALVAINKAGVYGAAAYGWTASYAVQTPAMSAPQVFNIPPFTL